MKKLKNIKLYEEFFFRAGELKPDFLNNLFNRIIEILKETNDVYDIEFINKEVEFKIDNTTFMLVNEDISEIVVYMNDGKETEFLGRYDTEEIEEIVNSINNYKNNR